VTSEQAARLASIRARLDRVSPFTCLYADVKWLLDLTAQLHDRAEVRAKQWAEDVDALRVPGWRTRTVKDVDGGWVVYVFGPDPDIYLTAFFERVDEGALVFDRRTTTCLHIGKERGE
jgi:hypothetical protein